MAQTPPHTAQRISRAWPFHRLYYGWAVLGAGVLAAFAAVPTQGPIVGVFVQPLRDDLGWSALSISLGFVLGSSSGGVFAFIIGGMLDRRGSRAVTAIAGVVIAASMIGLSLMTQPWHFWLFFGLARGTAAAAQLATTVSLASWFVRKRGRAVGILGTGQRLGQAVMPLPIFAIMAALSWREAWLALAVVVVLLLTVPSLTFVRRRPEDFGLWPDGGQPPVERTNDGPGEFAQSVEETWTLREAKGTRALWLLIAAQGGVVLAINATNLHITAHFQDQGIPAGLAVTTTAIFAATSATSTLPWGLVLEHVHTRYVGLFATGMFAVSMIVATLAESFPMAVLFAVIYGLALGAWTVTSRMLFANYFGRRAFGSIRGFAAPFMMIFSTTGPLAAGLIRDVRGGYELAFMIFFGVFILTFIAFLFATQPRKPTRASRNA
jgi:MFS family permease